MKRLAPDVVRKGALVRIAGGPGDDRAAMLALVFLDLRFEDGHVERWLGPGAIATRPIGPDSMVALQTWAREHADEQAASLMGELATSHEVRSAAIVDSMACEEVVIEWHAEPTWT